MLFPAPGAPVTPIRNARRPSPRQACSSSAVSAPPSSTSDTARASARTSPARSRAIISATLPLRSIATSAMIPSWCRLTPVLAIATVDNYFSHATSIFHIQFRCHLQCPKEHREPTLQTLAATLLASTCTFATAQLQGDTIAVVPEHPVKSIQDTETRPSATPAWPGSARPASACSSTGALYSIPAGTWNGKRVSGGEWIMNDGSIPVADYKALASQFNPTGFSAHDIVALAKSAGMKYIVITSKHHDGFAMFDSKADPFNIVAATPFKRDPLKELAEECRKQGIKLGFYYSQDQDWTRARRRRLQDRRPPAPRLPLG